MASTNASWGIEVGAGAIKAIKIERDGDALRVADFVVLPHKKVLSTPDLNKDDAVAVALGAFMSQYRDALRGPSVAVSIPGHSAFARFAKLPPVEKKGVANLVRFEAVQQIPFPIDEVEWDYQTFADESSPDIEVGIFAVTKARIAETLAQLSDQGLVPDIITLSPVAVYNAVAYDLAFTARTPGTVLLDIGATATDLIIAEAGRVWIRTFPLGGHNFTEALASTFKLTYGKAEKLKKEAETSKYKRHIFQAMKPVLGELVQDVQRSISYYTDTHPDAQITRLVGFGSTFKLIGLRKLLSQQLRLEVYRYEHAKRLVIEGAAAADFEAATPNLATAYGLALQGLGLQTINANLMPVPVIRKALWKRKTPWFVAAAGLGIVAGGVSFLRPAFESMAVASARADASVTRPINETTNLGRRLKARWTEASGGKQPGFVAENMRRLFEGRELHPMLLKDISAMFGAVTDAALRAEPALASMPRAVVELRSYDTEYLPPNTPFSPSSGAPAPGDFPGAGAGATQRAGEAGAVRISLVFDAPLDSRAFMNDSFLAWLRNNAQRAGVPYAFHSIPAAADIEYQRIPPPGAPGAPPTAPGRAPARTPPPPTDDDSDPFGGGPPSRQPGPPGRSGTGDQRPTAPAPDPEVEKIAPLPRGIAPPPPDRPMFRYRLSWIAQIRPAAEMDRERSGDTAGQEDDR